MSAPHVAHLSFVLRAGGAARCARRLHAGLLANGVASRILTFDEHEARDVVGATPLVPAGPRARLAHDLSAIVARAGLVDLQGLAWHGVAGSTSRLAGVDVLHLHWVESLFNAPEVLARMCAGRASVWTLHDMQPFTGGCTYGLGCERFVEGCGRCPQLGRAGPWDRSRRLLARRARVQDRFPDVVVAPSRWMAREAQRSRVFADHDVRVVPYGIDLTLFRPSGRAAAREALGLPQDRRVVTFAGGGAKTKGGDLLAEALVEARQALRTPDDVLLVSAGDAAVAGGGIPVHHVGAIADEALVAILMRASDVVVLPSRADNLPNVVLEAMASGVPVVAFDVGGVSDAVIDGETGLLAPPLDAAAFGAALARVLDDAALRTRLGASARASAEAKYSLERLVRNMTGIYGELHGRIRSARP